MVNIQYIRDNKETLEQAIKHKQMNPALVENVLALDEQRRSMIMTIQEVREQANAFQKDIKGKPTEEQITKGKEFKAKLADLEPQLAKIE